MIGSSDYKAITAPAPADSLVQCTGLTVRATPAQTL